MANAKKIKTDFNAHAAGLISNAQQPAHARSKGKITTFEIDPELDRQLARVTFWGGLDETRRAVINRALAYYFENDPDAIKKVSQAAPGEK